MTKIQKLSLTLVLITSFLFPHQEVEAFDKVHLSAMVNYEILNERWPGWDLTFIYNNSWGIRYTNIADVEFFKSSSESSNTLDNTTLTGALKLPMILKTWDYNTFSSGKKTVFDFITAYSAYGFNRYKVDEKHVYYTASSNSLVKSVEKNKIESDLHAFALGVYGGDRYLVVDARALYYRLNSKKSKTSGKMYSTSSWLIIVSAGVGF